MQITNNGAGSVMLPNGEELQRGATVPVADAEWRDMAKHPVVKFWLAEETLTAVADKVVDKATKPVAKPPGTDTGNPLA